MSPLTGLRRSRARRRSAQALELLLRALAYEYVDVALALEQPLDEMPADEAGRTGHEVAHFAGTLPGLSAPGRARAWSTPARSGKRPSPRSLTRNVKLRPREPAERNR